MSTLKTINIQHPTAASPNVVLDNLGNVNIPTSGARITGDFSNAPIANRVAFQTNVTNGNTSVAAIPNGTATIANFRTFSANDPTNSSFGEIATVGATDVRFVSSAVGTGTTLPMAFYVGASERVRIDTSGNVGIGTSSPGLSPGANRTYLTLKGRGTSAGDANGVLQFTSNAASSSGVNLGNIEWNAADNTSSSSTRAAFISVNIEGGTANNFGTAMAFATKPDGVSGSGTERMRIDAGGSFLVGKPAASVATGGFEVYEPTNTAFYVGITNTRVDAGGSCLVINRQGSDGNLIVFRQANADEGSISVSGTTVSYNGGHLARWSQLTDGSRDPALLKGTVLSNLDAMCEWVDEEGNQLPNEQLNRMKISDVEGDQNVAGVFVNWDNSDEAYPHDMNIAMTGDMIIRIAQGITVQRGDLLMSAGDGTAKPQGDDIVRSKTIAKVTSTHVTCTYEDGSYCVPCVLMAC